MLKRIASCGVLLLAIGVAYAQAPRTPAAAEATEAAAEDPGVPEVAQDAAGRGADASVLDEADEPPPEGTRYALLIGINDYKHEQDLSYCVQDMLALRNVLIEYCDYAAANVRLLTDTEEGKKAGDRQPTRGSIMVTLSEMLKRVQSSHDSVLVAFSGHGTTTPGGQSYLITMDGTTNKDMIEMGEGGIPVATVHKLLQRCPARQKVLIVDACRTPPGQKGDTPPQEAAQGWDPQDVLASGEGLVQLLSCSRGEASYEDPKLGHGVFSYFLAQGLTGAADRTGEGNKDDRVTADEVYSYVLDEVTKWVKANRPGRTQTPERKFPQRGRVILAVTREIPDGELTDRDQGMLEQLERLNREGKVSDQLLADSADWLAWSRGSEQRAWVRVMLKALAEEGITEDDFKGPTAPFLDEFRRWRKQQREAELENQPTRRPADPVRQTGQ